MTIGILAHVDAGKTTLSEGILYIAGAIRSMGRVDHKDTFLDTFELERSRGITIFSKQAVFEYQDINFTLLDTPGHSDFSPEMERTLQVLDLAVLVVSAPDGVTGQVKILWKLLDHYKVPTVIFVNKMDQAGMDDPGRRDELIEALKKELGGHFIRFDEGADKSLIQEELAVCDEDLLNAFLDGKEISKDETANLFSKRKAFPVLFGSALKMEGVQNLLDHICRYEVQNGPLTPSPGVTSPESFGARVYKISRDAQGSRLTHIKVTSGSVKIRDIIDGEKVDQIRIYSGDKYKAVTEVAAGMVCALTGLSGTKAGQGLGALSSSSVSEVLQPILSCALILPEDADPHVIYKQLKTLEEEEPMLLSSYNEETGDIELQIMGEVQEEILKHLFKTRFGIDVGFGQGHVVYKETIADSVEGVGHFEPLRHYAEVHLLLEPAEPGSGIIIENNCSTDVLSLNWQRLILTHLAEKKHRGVLTGSEITDIKITLLTGKAHEKHTEGGDFRQATYRAVRQGLMMADSVLLEPYFQYRIEVPQDLVGRALNDIQRMNGTVGLPDIEGNKSVITGTVPAACIGDYAKELSSYSHGEGKLCTTLSGYGPCHNPEEVIAKRGYDPALDTRNPTGSVFCSHGAGTVIPWDEVRDHMHLDTGWRPNEGFSAATDLTDSIDREALKNLQARLRNKQEDNRSFADIEKDIRMTENELKNIFERTYGEIKPRYVESSRVYTADNQADTPEESKRDLEVEQAKEEKYKRSCETDKEQKEYLLVDGYNVIYADPHLSDLAKKDLKAARDSLSEILCNFSGFRRENVILVFDAYRVPGGKEHLEQKGSLSIIYTKEAETADQYIEKAAHEIGKKYKITVATSDAIEQVIVMSSGAIRLSARDFWAEISRTNDMISEKIGKR